MDQPVIRLAVPLIEEDDVAAVSEALRSGFLVQGHRVASLERAIADVAGTTEAIVVSSGTAALHLSLLALGIGHGDRVAVPAYSFLATANVVELVGATPVFVDIEPETYGLAPERLRDAIATSPVAAVMPVHPFGQVADVVAIAAAAPAARIVEDAAAALGALQNGRPAGSLGSLGCFSLHPRKAITTGEGGAVTTDDAALARRIRALRNHGQDPESPKPDFVLAGFNYRMTELQAALGLTQIRKLDRVVAARREAAARYDRLFVGTPVRPPVISDGNVSVFQSYVVRLPDAIDRDGLIARLRERGIETQIGTYHMPMTRHFRSRFGFGPGDFPVTDRVAATSLALPLYPSITEDEQAVVAARLLELV